MPTVGRLTHSMLVHAKVTDGLGVVLVQGSLCLCFSHIDYSFRVD